MNVFSQSANNLTLESYCNRNFIVKLHESFTCFKFSSIYKCEILFRTMHPYSVKNNFLNYTFCYFKNTYSFPTSYIIDASNFGLLHRRNKYIWLTFGIVFDCWWETRILLPAFLRIIIDSWQSPTFLQNILAKIFNFIIIIIFFIKLKINVKFSKMSPKFLF